MPTNLHDERATTKEGTFVANRVALGAVRTILDAAPATFTLPVHGVDVTCELTKREPREWPRPARGQEPPDR